jgi:mannose-6-phosphate isomerase
LRLYPLKFYEILKAKIWGGRAIEAAFSKVLPPGEKMGESWEVSDHFDDVSVVRNGALEGMRLRELWRGSPKEVLGEAVAAAKPREFPLLVKFIDASEILSVQVHPDQEYAKRKDPKGESGKNEAWYVVAAEEGSYLVAGLKKGVSRDDFKRATKDGGVESCLNKVKVKAGDVVHVASGTVHAIGKGILIWEVQQTSDATYRIWDWGRMGADGKPRELHVDDALSVIDFARGPVGTVAPSKVEDDRCERSVLDKCESFVIERLDCEKRFAEQSAPGRFFIFTCISGSGSILSDGDRCPYAAGDTILVPAAVESVLVEPAEKSVILKAYPGQVAS